MANITPAIAQYFIPEVWLNRALEILRANVVLSRLVARDTDVGAFQVGDILHIPYPGTFTAQDKTPGSPVTVQTPSGGAEVQVTLNHHKEITFIVEDVARAQANQDLLDRYLNAAVPALAEAIERDLFALYTGVTNSVGTSGDDLTPAVIREARKKLNDSKCPLNPRNLVISSKDEIALLGDTSLAPYFANARAEAVSQGAIGSLYGFTVWMSQLVPVVSGTPNSTKNLAFHPEAFILAMRGLPEPPAATGAQAATLRDPESGLVMRMLYAYNPSYLGVQVTLDVLYGVQVLRPEKACVVLS
ncbi:MAG: P22 phage major capsid protein family protein [Armatimonadota bacterium]